MTASPPDELPPDLAALLKESAQDSPPGFSPGQAKGRLMRSLENGGAQGLESTVAAIESMAPAPTTAEVVLKALLSAKGAGLLGAGLLGVTAAVTPQPSSAESPTVARIEVQAPAVVAPPQVKLRFPEVPEASSEAPSSESARPSTPSSPEKAPSPDSVSQTEVEHLGQLRKLAQSDPARAVALARRGHRLYSDGMLYPEREGLLILSLARVGQTSEARRRAKKYIERFPHGALTEKLKALAQDK